VIGRVVDSRMERIDFMNGWVIAIINITVAGIVGGITNHLAIKMLFHPRRPVMLGGWKLPFTPGLIPKRKLEIASSLGEVVADYLVTPDGMKELIQRADFRESLIERAESWADQELGGEATIGSLLRRWFGDERADEWLEVAPIKASEWTEQAFLAWWSRGRLGEREIREIVPGWNEERVMRWAELATGWGLEALKRELVSADGQKLLRKLASGLMDRTGGFIGMLAGIFVDEDKLVSRLTPYLLQQLDSPALRGQLAEMLGSRLRELGGKSLDAAWAEFVSGEDGPEVAVGRWIREKLPWAQWADRIERFPVGEWLAARQEDRDRWLRRAVLFGLDSAERLMPSIMKAIRLPELVRTQVERFPVERLEDVILSVSGKEFKAITWLGVALGGLIGLIQTVSMLLWR